MRAVRSVPAHLVRQVPVQQALDLDTIREGEIVTYRIVLPFLPPSKNQINSWPPAWQSGAKKKWLNRIAWKCAELNVPKDLPQIGIAARLVFASKANRDPQNYAQQIWHWVPDALVRCGVLVDDNEGRVQIGPNWGIELAVDLRKAPKHVIEKTILTLAVRRAVPAGG